MVIDPDAVASALEKLRQHPEPEAGLMHTSHGLIPAYNVQAAVDAEHDYFSKNKKRCSEARSIALVCFSILVS